MFENIPRKYNSEFRYRLAKKDNANNWECIKDEWRRRYGFFDFGFENLIKVLEAEWPSVSNIDYSKYYKLDAEREAGGKDEIWEAKKKNVKCPPYDFAKRPNESSASSRHAHRDARD